MIRVLQLTLFINFVNYKLNLFTQKLKIMPYQSFEELEVWKKSRILKNEIFELVKTFPKEE